MNTLGINGTKLACVEQGAGQTVLLVHGALGDLRSWTSVAERLSTRYKVVTYSRRWHYPSLEAVTGAGYAAAVHLGDLLAIVEKLGPVHLVGHSYGAAIGAAAALHRPDLFRSLILAEPSLFSLLQCSAHGTKAAIVATEASVQIPPLLQQGLRDRALRDFLNIILGPAGIERISTLGREVMLDNLHTLAPMLLSMNGDAPFTVQHGMQIKAPTLLLDGEQTPAIFRITIEELQRALPNVRRTTLPDVSHGLHLENPAAFSQAATEYLAAVETQPASR